MATAITRGQTFGVSEQITNTKLHNLVDLATITGIVDADVASVNTDKLVTTFGAAGDILYHDGSNWVRLAKDAGKYLLSGASSVSWSTVGSLITTLAFDNDDLTTGVLAITGLKTILQVRDNNGYQVLPDNVQQVGGNTRVDIVSQGTITGNWAVDYTS